MILKALNPHKTGSHLKRSSFCSWVCWYKKANGSAIQPQNTRLRIVRWKKARATSPYTLTDAQKSAIQDILQDLDSGKPMNRLLQGDVGAGKTVVAKFAIQAVIKQGAQAAVMAPTAILAEQHFRTLTELLANDDLIQQEEIALLIGSTPQQRTSANIRRFGERQDQGHHRHPRPDRRAGSVPSTAVGRY